MTIDTLAATAPHDELDLLGSVFSGADPRRVNIRPEDFDQPLNATIWRAMLTLSDNNRTIDVGAVRDQLGAAGDRNAIYLFELYQRLSISDNADIYANATRRAAQLRNLQDMARRIMQDSMRDEADPAQIASWAKAKLDEPTGITGNTETLGEALPRVIDQLQAGVSVGLSTPWPDLDKLIHGFGNGRLYVFAGRPGSGKSLAGQNIALHWSRKHQLNTYFASIEMKTEELATRSLSQVGQVPMSALAEANLSEQDWDNIARATPKLQDARVHICSDSTQTVDNIRAGALQVRQRKGGLGLIVVDYLQYVTPRDHRAPRERQVSEISRGLKLIAKDLDVPVVALAQIRRPQGSDRSAAPTMNDLRESGAIEQDADVVMLLHLPDEADKSHGQILVAKARAGRRDVVNVVMRTHFATIANEQFGKGF